jgi:rRNA maturation RNase YbeY
VRITVDGILPRAIGITKKEVSAAAYFFAEKASSLSGEVFRDVVIVLQDDEFSAVTHSAVNGVEGPTDVTTQRYDPMPGEKEGVYGELYVNAERAIKAAPKRQGWSPAKELFLYIAHGMDHLTGADDHEENDFQRMRRRELSWLKSFDKKA